MHHADEQAGVQQETAIESEKLVSRAETSRVESRPYTGRSVAVVCFWWYCCVNINDSRINGNRDEDMMPIIRLHPKRSRRKMRFSLVVMLCLLNVIEASYYYQIGVKGCLMFNRTCVDKCPENMHRRDSECRSTPSQRTCENPVARPLGVICDWSRCDCDFPLVLHLISGYCFMPEDCPRDDEYTGHCPMLKFRYGKCYGDHTRQILKEIRANGLFNKPLEYRPDHNYEIDNMRQNNPPVPQRDVYEGLYNHCPVYMAGYTGYVPGMNSRYGKSYGRAADDCMTDFTHQQRQLRRKAELNKSYARSRSAPKMETIHSRDEIRRDLHRFKEINKYKENTISTEFPPIAGYTGHIPRIKGSEASLSQRYHCAAKRGLELIQMERDTRKQHQNADSNIKQILKNKDKKSSYYNWG